MKADFDKLLQHIRTVTDGKQIIYIPNPGNFGDGLIRYGTKRFLQQNNIQHYEFNVGYSNIKKKLLPLILTSKNTFYLYGGGGAWHGGHTFGFEICNFISKLTPNLLVLPTTYALDTSSIRGSMYRRDNTESIKQSPNSLFCHDMAFYLATLSQEDLGFFGNPVEKVGNLFRTDIESNKEPEMLPSNNIDLSTLGDHMDNADQFLRKIARYEIINTDRLHVAIGGTILGRTVNLHCGNYFKIRAIYEASLAGRFDSIKLV